MCLIKHKETDLMLKLQNSRSLCLLVPLAVFLTGCGGGSSATADNSAAPSASARTSVIASGDTDCPNGGVLVESGIDENKNGVLDDAEVDDSEKVCNGIDSHNSLIALNDEPAGANCPYGGIRIDSGVDSDDSGVLDSTEVNSSGYVCNQLDGSIGWQVATLVELDDAGSASYPQISFDANGDAIAVWNQSDGTRYNIWSNRYTAAYGWGTLELIETDNTGDAVVPQISFDANGNALAVWRQYDGKRSNIWANHYAAGVGWETAELIETDNAGDARNPQVSVDNDGNALAVWIQSDGTRYNIWSNRYLPGFGWGSAELIETDNAGSADRPQISIDSNGNALAVWEQDDGLRRNIWSNFYTYGVGWGVAELIETDNSGSAYEAQIGVDSRGYALAAWRIFNGSNNTVWANRYVPGSGWESPRMLQTDSSSNAGQVQIRVAPTGNALAVWRQRGDSRNNIWANSYTADVGWGSAELIETDNAGDAQSPQISVDSNSNALAVWEQSDGTRDNIWSNRYTAGVGWGSAELIETENAGDARAPQISVDSDGNALAVWYQRDGTRDNIWSNYWKAP
jgi:hypothetical protein